MPSFLAFDLGATSGRAMLGHLNGSRLTLSEADRFPNEPVTYGGEMHWDLPLLWSRMVAALQAVRSQTSQIDSLGVDSWGVDYALLGEGGTLLQNPFHYRDPRTTGMMEPLFERIGRDRIYEITGIQFMPINTLVQLFAAKQKTPRLFDAAEHVVTVPDALNYWLSGVIAREYTNATTTQLLDLRTRAFSREILQAVEIPARLFGPVTRPGSLLGHHDGIPVVAPGCHDTASAVAAVNGGDHTAFLSSGTWSLLGTEVEAPVVSEAALRLNFTNEGGVGGRIRLLKNITGLWLLEGCRRCWNCSYDDLLAAAAAEPPFRHLLNPDDPAFVNPGNMLEAIRAYCTRTGQPAPETAGAFTRSILESLALRYQAVLESLEAITGRFFSQLRVIGGGSKIPLLNQFTANSTGKQVLAGPAEATALGNIAVQMMAVGAVSSLSQARTIIDASFPPVRFEPRQSSEWKEAYQRVCCYGDLS